MRQALANKDQAAFKALWHPAGYESNLVGGSGIPGGAVFRQGSRKGWYLKPNMAEVTEAGDKARVYPCAIWSIERERAVDGVHAFVALVDGVWVLVGAGERRAEVDALVKRFVEGEELAPPAREGR